MKKKNSPKNEACLVDSSKAFADSADLSLLMTELETCAVVVNWVR